MAKLQLQIRKHRTQVGVAAAFAVPVHTALHVGAPGFHGRDGIRHRDIGIVVGVDADDPVEALAHLGHDLHQPMGERAAVGIAQHQNVRARALGGFQRPQREIRVGQKAVEEMLRVVDHFAAVLLQVAHGLRDQHEVLFFGDAQRPLRVQFPALAEDRDGLGLRLDQRPHVGILLH